MKTENRTELTPAIISTDRETAQNSQIASLNTLSSFDQFQPTLTNHAYFDSFMLSKDELELSKEKNAKKPQTHLKNTRGCSYPFKKRI